MLALVLRNSHQRRCRLLPRHCQPLKEDKPDPLKTGHNTENPIQKSANKATRQSCRVCHQGGFYNYDNSTFARPRHR